MILLLASYAVLPFLNDEFSQTTFDRGFSPATPALEVELATVPPNPQNSAGLSSRDADHATVAMNGDLDVAVAFHSSRTDVGPGLKQVEVAYYRYLGWGPGGQDKWEHIGTKIVGSVFHAPIATLPFGPVKCERPDIIAVDDMFFVVWTRRYEGSSTQLEHHPAVLECSWIELNSQATDFIVHDSGTPGLGYELQAHVPIGTAGERFEVLDCAGVADAVALVPGVSPTTKLKVAVAYPHQSTFPNLNLPEAQHQRIFDLRLVTCEFDTATASLSKSTPTSLNANVQFHGPKGLNMTTTAGLILPDLAPSSDPESFWIAAEGQVMTGAQIPHGIIKLQYWGAQDGTWQVLASKSFLSTGAPFQSRRRPSLSSYPASSPQGGTQTVSIAFNQADSSPLPGDPSLNVIHEEWSYSSGTIAPTSPVTMNAWLNSTLVDDQKPVALRGRGGSSAVRRAYFSQVPYSQSLPRDLLRHDAVAGSSSSPPFRR